MKFPRPINKIQRKLKLQAHTDFLRVPSLRIGKLRKSVQSFPANEVFECGLLRAIVADFFKNATT